MHVDAMPEVLLRTPCFIMPGKALVLVWPAAGLSAPGFQRLEHDPQKWKPLLRKDHAQAIDLARVLFDQVIPPGRNAR